MSEKGNARQGFFNDADFHALASKLPSYLHDFTRFGYLTGWRKGEIASLLWEDVDGDVIRLRAENTKNGEARTVTLGGELGELMERRKTERQVKTTSGVMLLASLVFHHQCEPVGDFRKAWATACVAAGMSAVAANSLWMATGTKNATLRRSIQAASSMTSAERRFATWCGRACRSGLP